MKNEYSFIKLQNDTSQLNGEKLFKKWVFLYHATKRHLINS